MLLSKSVIAALIATAAGGIIIGSTTTYVVVNNNDCVIPPVVEETSKDKEDNNLEFWRNMAQMDCARAVANPAEQKICDRAKKDLREKYGRDIDVTPTKEQIGVACREFERFNPGFNPGKKCKL